MTTIDGRRLRGDHTRRRVADRAAELASVCGLSGLTLGQLATDLDIAKSSVAAVFHTKEQLQLAAVDAARRIFIEAVVRPAADQPPGRAGLLALIEAWFEYVSRPVFPGGCFMVSTAAEYDSRPGLVRDALSVIRHEWLQLLESHIHIAGIHETGGLDPSALAFEIDAILSYANVAVRLSGNETPLATARDILAIRLAASAS